MSRGRIQDFIPLSDVTAHTEVVTSVTASTASGKPPEGCSAAEVISTNNCWIEAGTTPVAVEGTGKYLPADTPIRISVDRGQKIGVIKVAAAAVGSLSIHWYTA